MDKKLFLTILISVIFGVILGISIPFSAMLLTDVDREIKIDLNESEIKSVLETDDGYIVEYSLCRTHHIKASCDEVRFYAMFDDGSLVQATKVYSSDALTEVGPLTVSFLVKGIDKNQLKNKIPTIYAEDQTLEKYTLKYEN